MAKRPSVKSRDPKTYAEDAFQKETSSRQLSRRNRSWHAKRPKNTPLFRDGDFLSENDSRRVRRFRVQSCLRSQEETCRYFSQSRTILRREFELVPDSRSGLKMGVLRCIP